MKMKTTVVSIEEVKVSKGVNEESIVLEVFNRVTNEPDFLTIWIEELEEFILAFEMNVVQDHHDIQLTYDCVNDVEYETLVYPTKQDILNWIKLLK